MPERQRLATGDPDDQVTFLEEVDHREALCHATEHRVAAIEVGGPPVGEEELAPAGVLAGLRHAQRAAAVGDRVDLVGDRVARVAPAVAARAAALDDEARDDAVPGEAVVELLADEV